MFGDLSRDFFLNCIILKIYAMSFINLKKKHLHVNSYFCSFKSEFEASFHFVCYAKAPTVPSGFGVALSKLRP